MRNTHTAPLPPSLHGRYVAVITYTAENTSTAQPKRPPFPQAAPPNSPAAAESLTARPPAVWFRTLMEDLGEVITGEKSPRKLKEENEELKRKLAACEAGK